MPMSINSLMKYIRKNKRINISGSTQKRKLRYMGYFHGYKGYRYCRDAHDVFSFSNFNEMQAVYDFDMQIKSVFYPQIMFIETVLKNYALECVIEYNKTEKFADVFSKSLTYYKTFSVGSGRYKEEMAKRLKFREHVYSSISRDYKRPIVSHYYDKDDPVPIWAVFELLTLGEFGTFAACMNGSLKSAFSKSMGIKVNMDPDGKLPELFIFAIKDLRNAIAHNGVVFDTRFKTASINNRLATYITSETSITNISFETIADYLILLTVAFKGLKCSKKTMYNFVSEFEKAYESLRKQISVSIFNKILFTDTRKKIIQLKNYIKS